MTDTELPEVPVQPVLPPHQFAVTLQNWAWEAFYNQPGYPARYQNTEHAPLG